MKSSELRKLIAEYKALKSKPNSYHISEKLKEIEHRYYHETGRSLESDLT
ncbi:MAG: hypothetical protein ACT4NT_03730 [Nitrososphaerota archaeon]